MENKFCIIVFHTLQIFGWLDTIDCILISTFRPYTRWFGEQFVRENYHPIKGLTASWLLETKQDYNPLHLLTTLAIAHKEPLRHPLQPNFFPMILGGLHGWCTNPWLPKQMLPCVGPWMHGWRLPLCFVQASLKDGMWWWLALQDSTYMGMTLVVGGLWLFVLVVATSSMGGLHNIQDMKEQGVSIWRLSLTRVHECLGVRWWIHECCLRFYGAI